LLPLTYGAGFKQLLARFGQDQFDGGGLALTLLSGCQ
jgi:hypothetical protein